MLLINKNHNNHLTKKEETSRNVLTILSQAAVDNQNKWKLLQRAKTQEYSLKSKRRREMQEHNKKLQKLVDNICDRFEDMQNLKTSLAFPGESGYG